MERYLIRHDEAVGLGRRVWPHQAGVSLIELMIGLLIGLILIGGVIQTLLVSKDAERTRQNMAVITESARFAFEFMARDLRLAGRGFGAAEWDAGVLSVPIRYVGGVLEGAYYSEANGGEFIRFAYELDGTDFNYVRSVDGVETINDTLLENVSGVTYYFGFHDGSAISYIDHVSVAGEDWAEAGSVRITLQLSDGAAAGLNTRDVTTTIALRNRMAKIYAPN